MTIINSLKEKIRAKDKDAVIEALQAIRASIINNNEGLILELTSPAVIAELHKLLNEELGVPPRAMMIVRRVTSRNRKAQMFVQAMEMGLKRTA